MPVSAYFSNNAPISYGIAKPCPGWIVGYTAMIEKLKLPIPLPAVKAIVSEKYRRAKTESWLIFPFAYLPQDDSGISKIEALFNHLVFALKYEGVNLLVFAKLQEILSLWDSIPEGFGFSWNGCQESRLLVKVTSPKKAISR